MADSNKKSAFEILNAINVNEHTEKKNGLTYLSWAWAWQEVKKAFPEATYTIYENADGWNYFTDGKTCWVKTGVTIEGLEHIEYLPVMAYNNKSISVDAVTSFDVNKAIQRSLTKACARHGLGLYIYAGEDLPDSSDVPAEAPAPAKKAPAKKPAAKKAPVADQIICKRCGKPIQPFNGNTPQQVANATMKSFGKVMCMACGSATKQEQEAQAQMVTDGNR
jgi:hypothetical protein